MVTSLLEIDSLLFDDTFKKKLSEKYLIEFGCGETVLYIVTEAIIDLITFIYFALSNRPDLAIGLINTQILNSDQSLEVFERDTLNVLLELSDKSEQSLLFAEIGHISFRLKHFVMRTPMVVQDSFSKSTCDLLVGQLKCSMEQANQILIDLVQKATRELCEKSVTYLQNSLSLDNPESHLENKDRLRRFSI